MTTHENRLVEVEAKVNQLKGAYEQLATKADIIQLEKGLVQFENRLTRWIAGGVFLVLIGIGVQALVN